jgi:hypothetical protein
MNKYNLVRVSRLYYYIYVYYYYCFCLVCVFISIYLTQAQCCWQKL